MFIDFNATSEQIRLTFSFADAVGALIELNIPRAKANNGSDRESDGGLQELRRIVDNSRYSRSLCESCFECKWYQVMTLIRRCGAQAGVGAETSAVTLTLKDRNGVTKNIALMDGSDNAAAHFYSIFGPARVGHREHRGRAAAGGCTN